MSFLNPFLLFGLGAVAVPIIIHLINRRRIQRVVWAAMRFLRATIEQNQRRLRIEDIILLLLRCLLLILLALALARPAIRAATGNGAGQVKSTTIIILDNSYSMGMSDGVQTRLQKAQRGAEELVDALPAGSAVAVWLGSNTVRPLIAEPTRDFNLVRKVLREARLCARASDFQPILAQAKETLDRYAGIRREIYLFTDGQALGWRQWEPIQQLLQELKPNIRTHLVLVGDPETSNLAVSNLRLATSPSPVGQALRFEVQVTNFGKEDVRDVRVSLHVDNDPPSEEGTLPEIPAGSAKSLSLFAKLRTEGFHGVTARLTPDRLTADDERTIVVRALREVRVLLVDGDPGREPRESETFFLRHALVPVPPTEAGNYFVKVRAVTAAELPVTRWDDYDAVVLANVFDLPSTSVTALEHYLARGGGLIVFPGDKLNRGFYNEQLGRFLPAKLDEPRGDAESQEKFAQLQDKDYEHPIVDLWNDPAAGTLASAHFYRYHPLLPDSNGTARVVLKFSDGTPAVMERTAGLGRVILFNSTADTAWNDLPVRPAFVPLVYRALGSIIQRQEEGLNVKVGEPFAWRVSPEYLGKDTTIIPPPVSGVARDFGRVDLVGTVPLLRYLPTDHAGMYDVTAAGDAPLALKFGAQPDTVESSLLELSVGQLGALGKAAQVFRYPSEISWRERIEQAVIGAEFWGPLVWLAALVALVETVLAQWFSRSK
jgi:hypothetical protein